MSLSTQSDEFWLFPVSGAKASRHLWLHSQPSVGLPVPAPASPSCQPSPGLASSNLPGPCQNLSGAQSLPKALQRAQSTPWPWCGSWFSSPGIPRAEPVHLPEPGTDFSLADLTWAPIKLLSPLRWYRLCVDPKICEQSLRNLHPERWGGGGRCGQGMDRLTLWFSDLTANQNAAKVNLPQRQGVIFIGVGYFYRGYHKENLASWHWGHAKLDDTGKHAPLSYNRFSLPLHGRKY